MNSDGLALQVLCGKFAGGLVTMAAKKRCWEELAREVKGMSGIRRTADEIKTKWMYLKSATKGTAAARARDIRRTGGGAADIDDLSDRQKLIMSVIGTVCSDGVVGGFDSADIQLAGNSSGVHSTLFYFLLLSV